VLNNRLGIAQAHGVGCARDPRQAQGPARTVLMGHVSGATHVVARLAQPHRMSRVT